jgi:hypothetical protein
MTGFGPIRASTVVKLLHLLRRLRLGAATEGFHSFKGPLAGNTSSTVGVAPDSERQESVIHLLGLQSYSRVWNR